jgi:uncharacterized protein YndB with AHSA1/START domain
MFKQEEMGEIIDGHVIRFVRVVQHPPERVWRAITDERELSDWMRYPVKFEAREGGRAEFFDEEQRINGRIFIFDPPRTLAYSFYDPRNPDHERDGERTWSVRWDLEPLGEGCRITFIHRFLPAAALWGLGEGWHGFMDMLVAYFSGGLDELSAEFKRLADANDTKGLSLYRRHVGDRLLDWTLESASAAREAVTAGRQEDALAALDRASLGVRQLHRIARQEGARPDYSLPDAMPVVL